MARIGDFTAELNSVTDNIELTTHSGTVSITSSSPITGTYSYRANPAASTGFYRHQLYGSDQNKGGYLKMDINIATLPGTTIQILRFSSTGNAHLASIRLTSSGTLQLHNAANTQVGSASAALSTGVKYTIELKCDSTNATGTIDARLDGVSFASGNNSSRGSWARILWGPITPNSTCDMKMDNIIINDDQTGGTETSWPGNQQVITLRPNGAGESNQWKDTAGSAGTTSNYTLVDEVTPNDATDYVQSGTLNDVDWYDFGNSGLNAADEIICTTHHARTTNDTADATTTVKLQVEKTNGGTVTQGSAITPNSTAWQTDDLANTFKPTLVTYADPDAATWTPTTIDSMRSGVKLTAFGTNKILVSNVYVNVSYVPATLQTITGKSRITQTVDVTNTGKSRVTQTVDTTQTGVSRIAQTTDRTITGVSRISQTVDQTNTGTARIAQLVDHTQSGVSRVTQTVDATNTGKSRVTQTVDVTQTGVANIVSGDVETFKDQTGLARITQTVDQTQTAVSRITATVDRTQTAVSRITTTVDVTQTGKGRVETTVDQTQTGKSRITATTDQTITGKSRIEVTTDRTQTAVSRIMQESTQSQTGKSRIQQTVDQTNVGRSRISQFVDQIIAGVSRISATTNQTITGLARITVETLRTQTGKANMVAETLQTQTGKANLFHETLQTQTGKANMVAETLQTQTGKANLFHETLQTQTGKANMVAETLQTQTGKANLFHETLQTQTGKSRIVQITIVSLEGLILDSGSIIVPIPSEPNQVVAIGENTDEVIVGIGDTDKIILSTTDTDSTVLL